MKKYLWIVALLAFSLSFFACEYLELEEEEGDAEIIAELQLKHAVEEDGDKLIWMIDVDNGGLEPFKAAKWVVIITNGSANRDGFGGFAITAQSDGNWPQTDLVGGWFNFANAADEDVFIVIEASKLKEYKTFTSTPKGKEAKFFIQSWPVSDLGVKTVLLVGEGLNRPAKAETITGFGYMTKDFVLDRGEEGEGEE